MLFNTSILNTRSIPLVLFSNSSSIMWCRVPQISDPNLKILRIVKGNRVSINTNKVYSRIIDVWFPFVYNYFLIGSNAELYFALTTISIFILIDHSLYKQQRKKNPTIYRSTGIMLCTCVLPDRLLLSFPNDFIYSNRTMVLYITNLPKMFALFLYMFILRNEL